MGTVTFVLGLAGSGKSCFVSQLKVDKAFEEGFMGSEHETHHADLVERLKRGEHCAVSELQLLHPKTRDAYVKRLTEELGGKVHLNWVCFENDVAKANSNCRTRPNKSRDSGGEGHVRINEYWTKKYVIPDGAIVLRICVPGASGPSL